MAETQRRVVKTPDARRDEIVRAARALFAEQGVRATTITHVADRVGVTRGLVYHYVDDMETLVEQVLDACIDDFVADLRAWDAARRPGDVDGAVVSAVALLRHHVPTRRDPDAPQGGPHSGPAVPRLDDAALAVRFLDRAVEALVDTLETTTIPAYAARHTIEITHVRATFVVLVHGLIALVRSRPGTPDDVLVALVRQTLRLAPTDAPATDDPAAP
ncbi:TetR/AcrR family transcriptional regulator [Cellulomonas sp. SLBN-39]|uniref:TetR/AcrR family transcriptional regulator n=1 Tax=Cellulomonas sp. SLBN-39 TaxID=2768446 RepID=UPI0011513883|nr:TetR/AcrR family transcriptional regulator [Cellulomonas sp. SLBN-39]TQL01190.1 TetR family transcriptional regulator [Cellulomonas sp. SLBN-39]